MRGTIRPTIQRGLLAVAICALPLVPLGYQSFARRQRCAEIADNHRRLGAEYRRNARGDQGMTRIAAWHDEMARTFENAADEGWGPGALPQTSPFPPQDWMPASGTL